MEKNITIGKPNAKEIFYDDISKTERAMTDDEYYNFVKTSGKEIKSRIENEVMPKDLDAIEAKKEITNIKSDVREMVKTEMFGWGDFRISNEKTWMELKKNGLIQVPQTKIQDLRIDEKKVISFSEEDVAEINKRAMDFYSESVL